MGLGTLQVFITEPRNACRISNDTWRVNIAHCDGEILNYCGRLYFNIPAPCGRAEIDLPPGCYIVRAARGVRLLPGGILRGNVITDSAVVTVCCDDRKCITLYPPEIHLCGRLFAIALKQHADAGLVPRRVAQQALGAIEEVLALEEPSPQTALNIENLTHLAKEATKELRVARTQAKKGRKK